jgi:undecaprenyl-diphosphatase
VILAAAYIGMTITVSVHGGFPGDARILSLIHEHLNTHHAVRRASGHISNLVVDLAALSLIGAAALALVARGAARWQSLCMIAAALGSLAIKSLTLDYIDRPTPGAFYFFHFHRDEFPSGHAAVSCAIAAELVLLIPVWRRTLTVLAAIGVIAVGVSRLVLGVHYPSDVFAGWLLALALVAGLQVVLLEVRPEQPSRPEPEPEPLSGS